jgi:ATP synthase protein I
MPFLPPDQVRMLGTVGAVGLSFVLAVGLGAAAGLWLDRTFGTGPWLFFLFVILGFCAGVVNVYRATRRL